jgi:toxin CptA
MWRGGGWREVKARPDDIDLADANLVNEAWKRCMPFDKDVLQMHYVWRAPSAFICRRLKLKQGAGHGHIWDFALYHAQQAIDIRLQKVAGIANSVRAAYTLGQLITDPA